MIDRMGDDPLIGDLADLLGRLDPVPPEVTLAARSAFAWRAMDEELAELLYDSALDEAPLAGVRSEGGPRMLSFGSTGLTVELEVAPEGAARRLVGQLVPPGPAEVEIRHQGGSLETTADELGRFAVGGVPAGPMSILCRAQGGPAVGTAWVTV